MKTLVLLAAMFGCSLMASGQASLDSLMAKVQVNNLTLQAAQKALDAQKAEARVDFLPDNPTVSMGYMPGSPSAIGTKKTFGISQGFDFPTTYIYKNKVVKSSDAQAEAHFRQQQTTIMKEVAALYYQMVALNGLSKNMERQIADARALSELYSTRLKTGEGNILDYNKAKLQLTALRIKGNELAASQAQVAEQLTQLNGSVPVSIADTTIEAKPLPTSIEELSIALSTNSPTIAAHQSDEMLAKQQLSLSRAQWLPQLEVGYEMEKTLGDKFSGVRVGMSIPLWQNKSTVKHARIAYQARQLETQDVALQAKSQLQQKWHKANQLQEGIAELQNDLSSTQTNELLHKALLAGEISLIQYFQETAWYYEMAASLINMQKEHAQQVSEIRLECGM